MRGLILLVAMVFAFAPRLAEADTIIVFVDGSRMEIQKYEVKEGVVLFTTKEGKLRSVPRSYVNLVATEQANRGGQPTNSPSAPAPAPAPAPPPKTPAKATPSPPPPPTETEMPTESIEPEPQVQTQAPMPAPTPAPARGAPAVSPTPNVPGIPPPVWSNNELEVSLAVPSSAWTIEEMPASFDVAVTLENKATEAKATLALIREKIRTRKEFSAAVRGVESSISQAPGYRPIENAELSLDPYTAHEFRFVKSAGFVPVFNRLVVFYSRDLGYVLSLTCPESKREENQNDFEALVRGLVIKKSRKDLSF
jgi:outer membrane biosynthesis protein TonB